MRKRATIVGLLGLALFLLLGAAQCSSSGGTTTTEKCATQISKQPHFDSNTGLITAETKSQCDKTPDSHHVTITLWYHPYPNGNVKPKFRAMGNSESGARPGQNAYPECGVTPKPGETIHCVIAKSGICKVGIWKITVLVTGSMQGVDFGRPGSGGYNVPSDEEKLVHIDHCARNPNG
jgi:hypothetical protein